MRVDIFQKAAYLSKIMEGPFINSHWGDPDFYPIFTDPFWATDGKPVPTYDQMAVAIGAMKIRGICAAFGRFAGKKVRCNSHCRERQGADGDGNDGWPSEVNYSVDEGDETIREMKGLASAHGLSLSVTVSADAVPFGGAANNVSVGVDMSDGTIRKFLVSMGGYTAVGSDFSDTNPGQTSKNRAAFFKG